MPNKIKNIIEVLKITAYVPEFPPEEDRIHLANGTLFLDGSFDANSCYVVRTRLPVAYNPGAPEPVRWKAYLEGLLWPEDIVTFQEFVGYCLLPTNKAQRMMIIKGSGGGKVPGRYRVEEAVRHQRQGWQRGQGIRKPVCPG